MYLVQQDLLQLYYFLLILAVISSAIGEFLYRKNYWGSFWEGWFILIPLNILIGYLYFTSYQNKSINYLGISALILVFGWGLKFIVNHFLYEGLNFKIVFGIILLITGVILVRNS